MDAYSYPDNQLPWHVASTVVAWLTGQRHVAGAGKEDAISVMAGLLKTSWFLIPV